MKRLHDGVDVQGKQPCFYFYPADYDRDMAPLSLAAQGLWSRMLCKMHWAARRGFLEHPTGEAITPAELGRMVGATEREIQKLLAEMTRVGTFSRDDGGVIYSRRMVKDTDISHKRKAAAAESLAAQVRNFAGRFAGAKINCAGTNQPANVPVNGPAKTPLDGCRVHRQNTVLSLSPSLSPSGITPLPPLSADEPAKQPAKLDVSFGALWDAYPTRGRKNRMTCEMIYAELLMPLPDDARAELHRRMIEPLQHGGKWAVSQEWAKGYVSKLENYLRERKWDEQPEAQDDGGEEQETITFMKEQQRLRDLAVRSDR